LRSRSFLRFEEEEEEEGEDEEEEEESEILKSQCHIFESFNFFISLSIPHRENF